MEAGVFTVLFFLLARRTFLFALGLRLPHRPSRILVMAIAEFFWPSLIKTPKKCYQTEKDLRGGKTPAVMQPDAFQSDEWRKGKWRVALLFINRYLVALFWSHVYKYRNQLRPHSFMFPPLLAAIDAYLRMLGFTYRFRSLFCRHLSTLPTSSCPIEPSCHLFPSPYLIAVRYQNLCWSIQEGGVKQKLSSAGS